MLLIFGPIVADGRGSIAGTTFSRNGSGAYAKTRVTPVNPKTVPQEAVRVSMSILSARWTFVLTPIQRDAWDDYALATKIPNKLGQEINVGGRQMFLRTNVSRQLLGIGIVDAAPATPGVADAPLMIYAGDTTNGIEGSVVSPTVAGADLVSIGIGIPVNPTVKFYATPFTFAVGVVAASPQPILIKPAAELVIGQRYFLEARYYQSLGKVSFKVQSFVDILA